MKKLLAVSVLLLSFLSLVAAPLPFQKPERNLVVDDLVGDWKYTYGGSTGTYHFNKDGTFYNKLGTIDYFGTWMIKLDGDIFLAERGIYVQYDNSIAYGPAVLYLVTFPKPRERRPKKLEGTSRYNTEGSVPTTKIILEK